jgi:hypothetical protein
MMGVGMMAGDAFALRGCWIGGFGGFGEWG